MTNHSASPSVLVVVSHYNAWPADQLVALLDQMASTPAGQPFRVRVVVNRAEDKDLELPGRHSGVEVLYRENVGYNIGAWDHGWCQPPHADEYLFLQEECAIQRPGWLRPFARAVAQPGVGLAGESRVLDGLTWEQAEGFTWWTVGEPDGDGPPETWAAFTRRYLRDRGIDPTASPAHLQALVLYARRQTLEAIDGFPIDERKDDAIGCEVAISKRVEAVGLGTVQVAARPFEYILHPQWASIRGSAPGLGVRLRSAARRAVGRLVPAGLLSRRRGAASRPPG